MAGSLVSTESFSHERIRSKPTTVFWNMFSILCLEEKVFGWEDMGFGRENREQR